MMNKFFMSVTTIYFLTLAYVGVFAEGVPFSGMSKYDKSDMIQIKFIAENEEEGKDESFPHFIADPVVGDFVQGFTGKWYRVKKRTFDWERKPARSPNRFTIWLEENSPDKGETK